MRFAAEFHQQDTRQILNAREMNFLLDGQSTQRMCQSTGFDMNTSAHPQLKARVKEIS